MLDSVMAGLPAYMLVFVRMAAMIGTNPLLSRRNVPAAVRAGLTALLTFLIAPGLTVAPMDQMTLVLAMIKEFLVGFACGYVFQIFYYMLFFAGDVMDMQFGLSMAKVFDPGTNMQVSVSGNFLNILFSLFIFATNSHLLLVRIFATSFQIVPAGFTPFSPHVSGYIADLFIEAFSLALRLALPFIAVEFVLEVSLGILMKLIPQIHVFVINFQLKVFLSLVMLLTFAAPLSSFLDNYMNYMLECIQKVLWTFTG